LNLSGIVSLKEDTKICARGETQFTTAKFLTDKNNP